MSDAPSALPELARQAFRLLTEGGEDRDAAFRTPTAGVRSVGGAGTATTDADGLPAVRSVVLRGFDPQRRVLQFHSDARAAKVGQLQARPALSMHVWDAGRKLQMRVDGEATVDARDAAARAAWDATPPRSRAGYHQEPGPNAWLADPADARPDALDEEAAFANFALVSVQMHTLEWLELRRDGNRRALLRWRHDGFHANWLAP